MTVYLCAARALALAFVLGASSALAGPIPAIIPHDSSNQLIQPAREQPSRTETTKAWLKTKKNQTVRWVDRQKNKLKRLAD
ncbi:MAG TPA: hypothetical protein VHG30_09675 [Microvirga sp.]|nr:hypothetical protein [Microvirga sp.]